MQGTIRIGIFQLDSVSNDIQFNQQKIEQLLTGLKQMPELLFLPEMFATGYSVDPSVFPMKELEKQIDWQLSASKKFNVGILGSTVIFENGHYFNRLNYTLPDGRADSYDKRHLFRMGEENLYYHSGEQRKLVNYKGILIMPLICYDLRFPVWSRNNLGYHILFYASNWPANRQTIWNTLLPARAIENQSYTIGVNRVGTDSNAITYEGGSSVYNPKGELLLRLGSAEEYSELVLSLEDLLKFRNDFPAYLDADEFEITG
jgi:omega-amidase